MVSPGSDIRRSKAAARESVRIDRGVTDDGWFYLQTGGWVFRKVRDESPVELDSAAAPDDVPYLDEKAIAYLTSVPTQIDPLRR